mmetsp:Transcript_126313/g.218856  ORF Transcript_126313/g.218856 Transcript_126313/m.218856 type:complete len:85 (-) Transcript_126313:413-667(-)
MGFGYIQDGRGWLVGATDVSTVATPAPPTVDSCIDITEPPHTPKCPSSASDMVISTDDTTLQSVFCKTNSIWKKTPAEGCHKIE